MRRPFTHLASGLALLLALGLPHTAVAQSFGEAKAQIAAIRNSGGVQFEKQKPILDRFDAWAQQFYARAQGGNDRSARELFESLYPLLKALYDHNDDHNERLVQKTIADDGDLEATQDSPAFRDAELARLRTLYHLNWVSYLGATLVPTSDSRRKGMLGFAVEGFGEFVVGPDEKIAIESLYGRAQSLRGLGRTREAIADLKRLVALGPSSPHFAEARAAIPETYLSAGNVKSAVREADKVIAEVAAGKLNADAGHEARLVKVQAIFTGLKKGSTPKGKRAEDLRTALRTLREIERAGSRWRKKARAVANWGLDGLPEANLAAGTGFADFAVAQSLLLKGKYGPALDRLAKLLKRKDVPARERSEATFLAGLSAFQIQNWLSAARYMNDYLKRAPNSRDAPEAAYLRFKALEKTLEKHRSETTLRAYQTALRRYLEGYPKHSAAAEARFRLAESLAAEGQVQEAVAEFDRVRGNATLVAYARFNAAQALFEMLRGDGAEAETRAKSLAEAVDRLSTLSADLEAKRVKGLDDSEGEELGAKTSLMGAMLATDPAAPDYEKALALVAGFSKRFPNRPALTRQAFALEIAALQRTGDPKRAEAAIEEYIVATGGNEKTRRRLMKKLGREFYMQAEADRAGGRGDLANAATRVAVMIYDRLYEELVAEADAAKTLSARRGLIAVLAKLHRGLGDTDEAIRYYAALLEAEPGSVDALRALGEIAVETGQHESAGEIWLRLAAKLDPKERSWLDLRREGAEALTRGGAREKACRAVRETREQSPYPITGSDRERFADLDRLNCG